MQSCGLQIDDNLNNFKFIMDQFGALQLIENHPK